MPVLRCLFPGEIDLLLRPVLGPWYFSVKSHDFGGFAGFSANPRWSRCLIILTTTSMLRRTKKPAS